jgi:uncharacterized glyoxalase superfamily protein PhnB
MSMDLPHVAPMVSYEDVAAASEWLCAAFGFREISRFENGGRVTHVSLAVGDGIVMLGWPGPHYRSPGSHRETCEDAQRWLETPFVVDGVYVRVDDIDAHRARADAAHATMLSEVEDNTAVGQRQYRAEDLEGHRWMFAQPLQRRGPAA